MLAAVGVGSVVATLVTAMVPPVEVVAGVPAAALTHPERGPDPCDPVISGLTPRQRLAQVLMMGVDPKGPEDARAAVAEGIGGIFVGGNPTALLVDGRLPAVAAGSALPLIVAVDDEGGRVQRVDELDGDLPSARQMAATMTVDQVRALARDRAARLTARGVTLDFAPVVDLTAAPDRTVIGDRSFSPDPDTAIRYAGAFADGLRDGGMLPVLKHFPGHGRATGDSHGGRVTTPPLDELRGSDLRPYRELPARGPVAVMVGHLDVPGLTGDLPASLDPAVYRLLREDLGFDGLTFTDDLGAMRAISDRYDLPEAVLRAFAAGADVPFWSSGGRLPEILTRLEAAVTAGELPTYRVVDSLRRVLRYKRVC
ncbi:beta-N-acetylhexosaminidase [Actinokineospora auranticolor]|uniref:beta-N-acetylhexosaminidase n=1 Tax=Actinokineospora auranticolor TaxID=155976 RepID=A0A2S6GUQ6_9PSEU|nr:beta-N-acetylhexosaminidase [Actinokineospora auranticolor]